MSESIAKITVTALHSPLDLKEYAWYIGYVGIKRTNRKGEATQGRNSNACALGRNYVSGWMDSKQYGQWKKWLEKKGSDQLVTISEEMLHEEIAKER